MPGERIVVVGSDARHIKKVLRLRPGDTIRLCDGQGLFCEGRIAGFQSDGVEVELLTACPAGGESPLDLTIAQGYLKDSKMDSLARQLTEIGVSKWIPYHSQRSVSKPDKKRLAARIERWKRISREAVKQCRRGYILAIEPLENFEDLLQQSGSQNLRILFWEDYSGLSSSVDPLKRQDPVKSVLAVLGPEGGFTPAEVDAAVAEGFGLAGLGPRILRAETAALTAAVLLQHLFGDLGKKS